MSDFIKRPRREPMSLQLTAMIDIFSMIVIFLILGTVSGAAEIEFPEGFLLPSSLSKENAESAPHLMISLEKVEFKALKLEYPIENFLGEASSESPALVELTQKLKDYAKGLPITSKSSGLLLNVMADERVTYDKVFDVLRVFRGSGFETLLFVTTPKKVIEL